jgi:hypothetical protein
VLVILVVELQSWSCGIKEREVVESERGQVASDGLGGLEVAQFGFFEVRR